MYKINIKRSTEKSKDPFKHGLIKTNKNNILPDDVSLLPLYIIIKTGRLFFTNKSGSIQS